MEQEEMGEYPPSTPMKQPPCANSLLHSPYAKNPFQAQNQTHNKQYREEMQDFHQSHSEEEEVHLKKDNEANSDCDSTIECDSQSGSTHKLFLKRSHNSSSKNKFDTKNLVKNFLNAFISFVNHNDEE